MNKQIFRINSGVLLLVSLALICCLIYSYGVIKKSSKKEQLNYGYRVTHYLRAKVVDGVVKLKEHNYVQQMLKDYSNREQSIIDEEIYKKYLNIYLKNSTLFATLISIKMSSMFIVLRRSRRAYFEETCFMILLILKSYIHRVDGEWEVKSLKHSF